MAKATVYSNDDDDLLLGEGKALMEPAVSADLMEEKTRANEFETMECPICLQICVHPSKLPCGHIFCFLCVKGLKNRRCAMCRTEFPIEFLERPELLLPIGAIASTSASDPNEYQWFYKGRNGWWQYDERTCQEIEDAYKIGQKQCTILVAGYVYVVDFDQMLQQRQTDLSRKRQVKRDLSTIPKKGVAGLRLPNSDASTFTDDPDNGADENVNSNSNLIATIAATEAAIRIASDIIDSTLAHADEYQNENSDGHRAGGRASSSSVLVSHSDNEHITNSIQLSSSSGSSNSSTSNFSNSYNHRNMLDEIEETLNITNPSSINNSFGSAANNLDDFLDEFRHLTMNNIADDSSSDDNNDDDDDDDGGVDFSHEGSGNFTEPTLLRR